MPKVFGFLSKLRVPSNKELLAPTSGPLVTATPQKQKKRAHRFNRRSVSRTRPNREARKYLTKFREEWFRKAPKRLQTAKSKTIRNDYLKLQLEEARDNYQASLASQRAVSAANLQRELAEFGVSK